MILVTGCSTQTGKLLVDKLLADGNKVRCFDFERPDDLDKGIECITGDLTDLVTVNKACKGIDVVFHFMDMPDRGHNSRRFMRKNNIKGTKNMIEAAQKNKVKHFYYISTYEIYGRPSGMPTKPDDKKKPYTRYGKHKLKAEKYCWETQKKSPMPLTIFRPALTIGPGTDNATILITLFMALGMDNANRLYIAGNGDNKFQLLHPEDASKAIFSAFKKGNAGGKIYNLGSDNVHTQLEQVVKIKDTALLDCEIKHLSPGFTIFLSYFLRPFNIRYLDKAHLVMLMNSIVLDCQDTKKDLDWEPGHDNIQILKETIDWYKKEKL